MFGLGNNSHRVQRSVKLTTESGPAVSLEKIPHVDLRKKSEAAGTALAGVGLAGIRAQAVCVLDYSGSMYGDYSNGQVQELTERFLGFALQIDADGEIPIIPFESRRLPTIDINVSNYQGVINRELVNKYGMGSTNLADALEEVKRLAQTTDAPLFVGVVTDGNPDSESDTTRVVCELASYPVFIKFLALRDVPYLDRLDNLGNDKRLLDNVNTQTFRSLTMTDAEFANAMAEEWSDWIKLATQAGILTN
jgi:hypothetical protein